MHAKQSIPNQIFGWINSIFNRLLDILVDDLDDCYHCHGRFCTYMEILLTYISTTQFIIKHALIFIPHMSVAEGNLLNNLLVTTLIVLGSFLKCHDES